MGFEFDALCSASISKNGSVYVLLRFHPPHDGHLLGELPKSLGEIERDAVYHITISKVEPE